MLFFFFFFFQAEDGIRDIGVTGVQTCALPISKHALNSKYFSNSMVIPLSILLRVFGDIRAARERYADDLSKDEFFDQHRRGQRKGKTADDYQTLQHRFHD